MGELATVMLKVRSRVPKDGCQRHVPLEVWFPRGRAVMSSKPAARQSTGALVERVHDEPSVIEHVVTTRRASAAEGLDNGASCVPAGAQHATMLTGEEFEHAVMPGGREYSAATSAGVGGVHLVAASPDLLHRFFMVPRHERSTRA